MSNSRMTLFVLALFVALTVGAQPPRHVVLISIDGLMPETYQQSDELGLKVPNLRALAVRGAWAEGVAGILPSVTYPAHTTLITGALPRVHGITSNTVFDPHDTSDGAWNWFTSQIRVPTLVSAAEEKGMRTAAAWWPVSVGMKADLLVPEYWRSRHEIDREFLTLLSTPNLVDQIGEWRGRPLPGPDDVSDRDRTDMARFMIETFRPHLLLLHLIEVDFAHHDEGPRTGHSNRAIEAADQRVGEVLASLEKVGILEQTLIAIVSDHGFIRTGRMIKPNVVLRDAGLLTTDERGRITEWEAYFQVDAASAALVLRDPSDKEMQRRVTALFENLMTGEDSGIHALIDEETAYRLGSPAPLVIDPADGYKCSPSAVGEWIEEGGGAATHGFDPRRPGMNASLILAGPIDLKGNLGIVPMTSIAPTIAKFLGIELGKEAGEPLATK